MIKLYKFAIIPIPTPAATKIAAALKNLDLQVDFSLPSALSGLLITYKFYQMRLVDSSLSYTSEVRSASPALTSEVNLPRVPCYTIGRLKIIAHGIKSLPEAKNALAAGVDFLEIDVSKRFFFNKFTTQHNGLMGIFGIGPILETLLTAEVRSRAFLDLKPVSWRNSFTHKFTELLLKLGVKNAKVCGHDWQMLSNLSKDVNAKPYYTIKNLQGIDKLRRMVNQLKKPRGFSIKHNLINKSLIQHLKSDYPTSELWAFTVNSIKEAKRLKKLGVDGIITDEWAALKEI